MLQQQESKSDDSPEGSPELLEVTLGCNVLVTGYYLASGGIMLTTVVLCCCAT